MRAVLALILTCEKGNVTSIILPKYGFQLPLCECCGTVPRTAKIEPVDIDVVQHALQQEPGEDVENLKD